MGKRTLPKATLRERAERVLATEGTDKGGPTTAPSVESLQQSLHELDVHRIELEMQNEELRNLQGALEASRMRYFQLFESAPIALLTLSANGMIQEANAKAQNLLGVEGSRLIKQALSRYIHPDSQDTYYLFQKQTKLAMLAQSCELQMVSAQGHGFWAHIEGSAIPPSASDSASPGGTGLRLSLGDISHAKATEEELTIAGTAFESRTGKLVCNHKREVLRVNRAHTQASGFTQAELAGKPFHFLDLERHGATFASTLWDCVDRTGTWSGEVWSRHKDGSSRLEHLELFSVNNKAGVLTHYVANFRDLSELDALRSSSSLWQNRFHALFENALNSIVLTNNEGQYLDANPAACALLGYARQELLALRASDLLVADTALGDASPLWKKHIDARSQYGRLGMRSKSGQLLVLEYTAVTDIQPGLHLTMLSDVTAQIHAEKALRETQHRLRTFSLRQQEEFDQLRSSVARDLHDQIGQTLTALKLEVDFASTAIPDSAPRMHQLIRNAVATVRDVSRTLRPAILDFGLPTALMTLAQDLSMRSDVDIELEIQPHLPSLCLQHEQALYRIAQEALSNATKHACARHIAISLSQLQALLTLEIMDDGCGFDPSANSHQGGLGLSGMQERCSLMGASFSLKTSRGAGTRIRVELAVSAEGAAA